MSCGRLPPGLCLPVRVLLFADGDASRAVFATAGHPPARERAPHLPPLCLHHGQRERAAARATVARAARDGRDAVHRRRPSDGPRRPRAGPACRRAGAPLPLRPLSPTVALSLSAPSLPN
eukprot:5876803-Prymnesium_polylepis.1